MSRTLLVLVSVFALAACGGGGDGAPAAEAATAPASLTGGTATSSVPAAALGTTTAQASTATRTPDATNVAAPSATAPAAAPATTPTASTASTALCGPNPGGAMFACDPRWPYPGLTPANGATQAEVDGYNANCQTARCLLVRCDDARVLPGHMATACLFRPVVPTAALRRTDGAPTTRA